ncbi:MAG: NUDIX domain-containing protein [Oscillospiraceae bacterium]|nr:NUDIX domain-containing protein [Oscillospiraceae bacterium]
MKKAGGISDEDLLYNAAELIQLCDEEGKPAGVMERRRAHQEGKIHLVVHLWLFCREADGDFLYFQQRSMRKKSQPGLYDLASTGHVSGGEEALAAAMREAEEEIGLMVRRQELRFLGFTREGGAPLEGGGFDREVCAVFLCRRNAAPMLAPGPEVIRMARISVTAFAAMEEGGTGSVAGTDPRTGEELYLTREMFCPHTGEFERLVRPQIG